MLVIKVPHAVPTDVEFKGYFFPEGTIVMSNLYAVHFDEEIWPEPYKFKPERHITPEGKIYKKDQHILFGIGKRLLFSTAVSAAAIPTQSLRGEQKLQTNQRWRMESWMIGLLDHLTII